jgi:lipopolysaccharide transport system permease protein
MPLMLKALWEYRQFILSSVAREFQGRYRASLLGAFWVVAQPLTLMVIYTVIFGQLMRASLPGHEQTAFAFSIYLCAGVVFWGFHAEVMTRMASVFVDQANLMKKTAFPRVCLPAIVTGSALVNLSIIFGLYLLFLALIGHWPGVAILMVIPLLLLQALFALGLGLLLGTLNVFFRDVSQFVAVVLQFWFWLTPIVYTTQIVPERFLHWLLMNPMQPIMAAYQTIFLDRAMPLLSSLTTTAVLALLFLLAGGWVFWRHADELVDEL